MKRRNGLTLAAVVLLFSACSLASTIDPGGIIRSGDNYDEFAIIGEGFSISFDGKPLPFPFNPFSFTDSFCPEVSGTIGGHSFENAPDCQFLNESGQTIDSLTQIFSADAAAFEAVGGLSCFNDITGVVCPTPNGNSLLFSGLGIPSAREYSDGGYGTVSGDPFFNIINFGFDNHEDLAQVRSLVIPEPASLGLMLSGLFGLGLVWKRKAYAKRQ